MITQFGQLWEEKKRVLLLHLFLHFSLLIFTFYLLFLRLLRHRHSLSTLYHFFHYLLSSCTQQVFILSLSHRVPLSSRYVNETLAHIWRAPILQHTHTVSPFWRLPLTSSRTSTCTCTFSNSSSNSPSTGTSSFNVCVNVYRVLDSQMASPLQDD